MSALVVAVVAMTVVKCWAADEVFDARGLNPHRTYSSQLPFERIDSLNGDLLLVFTDLSLPGNAGFDLKLQRTYNSKIFLDATFGPIDTDSWAGVGWSFHLGRVSTSPSDDPYAVEMPDGSRHKLFPFIDGSGRHATRDYWMYDRNASPSPQLKLTNGLVYTFGKVVAFGSGHSYRYPTKIADAFGNHIDIAYDTGTNAAPDAFLTITQYIGSETRQVTFTSETGAGGRKRLKTMTYSGRTWTYSYISSAESGASLLTSVQPPVGPSWSYGYTTSGPIQNELVSVTTPNGGTITYAYGTQGGGSGTLANYFYLGSSYPVSSRVVTTRTTGGRAPAGTWTYAYAQGANKNQTIVTEPSGCSGPSVTTHTFLGVGNNYATASVWSIGLLYTRETKQGTTILETEQLDWRLPLSADFISSATETVGPNTDTGIYAPVVGTRTVKRFTKSYVTTNKYNSKAYDTSSSGHNFNDYGRAYQLVETGDAGTRTTDRAFTYGFTPYIVDRLGSESVTVNSETFTKSWGYNTTNGFMTSQTIYGVQTTYSPDTYGNVASQTNANTHTTNYTYDWGVLQNTTPPESGTATTRVINQEGTVKSETRRGFTTSFTYDDLFRPKTRTPPVGNVTATDYDNTNGTWTKVSRGSSYTQTTLDGFGRSTATANSVSVETSATYDACGQKTAESYPYDSTYPKKEIGYTYDGLDRLTRKTNPDASYVSYTYDTTSGIDVTVTDENGHATSFDWSAFGEPRGARLMAVTDAKSTTFTYSYNAVGSLTGVTATAGIGDVSPNRTWHYNSKSQLDSETHPESGTVTYTYYAAGNLWTKTDPAFGKTTYSYDQNERLTSIARPTAYSAYNTTIGYDGADNRTLLQNNYVTTTFGFDGANRIDWRQDVVNGQTLFTNYTPDANDNIQQIDYPSGNSVAYSYDTENRLSTVTNAGTMTYANSFQYHPSGNPLHFYPSGDVNLAQTFTYDANRYWLKNLDTKQRSLTYGYDYVGNPTSILDNIRSTTRNTIAYDELDRLKAVTGFAGGSYTYDKFGNRTASSVSVPVTPTTYTYDTATARLKNYQGWAGTLLYDGNGNLTSDGDQTYTYTPDNLLATVGPPAGPTKTYEYDGDGLRTVKLDNASGANRYYVHGPGGQILSELEEACSGYRNLVRDYVYAGSRLLAEVTPVVPAVRVGFQQPTLSVSEGVGTLQVPVVVTTSDLLPTHCPIAVSYATADGTAIGGVDYTPESGTLRTTSSVGSGSVIGYISIPIRNDDFCGSSRGFSVRLSNATGASIVAGLGVETVTITDDDLVCVSGTKAVVASGPGGPVTYTIILTNSGSMQQGDNAGHEFTDTLSSLLTLDGVTASSGVPSSSANTVFWDGVIPAGGVVTLTINAHANAGTELQVISNTGNIYYDQHHVGSNNQNTTTNSISLVVGTLATKFYTVTPCRIVDTRSPTGPVGGPSLIAGAGRAFPLGGYCGIPANAKAVVVNLTVVNATVDGFLTIYPFGASRPRTSAINFRAGIARANNATLLLPQGQVSVYCGLTSGTADLILDVTGYFQ